MKRLQAKKATYNVAKWEGEYSRHKHYQSIISENPYEFGDYTRISKRLSTAGEKLRLNVSTHRPKNSDMLGPGMSHIGGGSISNQAHTINYEQIPENNEFELP